jgi:hypothetical protein
LLAAVRLKAPLPLAPPSSRPPSLLAVLGTPAAVLPPPVAVAGADQTVSVPAASGATTATAQLTGDAKHVAAFDRVAMAEPRTSRLAGSPEEGRITYVSRSRVWGFPDYTTVGTVPDGEGVWLVIYARARFGREDFGVNADRVGRWLSAIPGYDPGPRPVS